MTTAATSRKSFSIDDYPEHLNPFNEDDHHNKIRFWTLGRRLTRSNSINFSGIKDLKNSWAFRSFMKKGKKREPPAQQQNGVNKHSETNGDSSPIVYRRAMQYSQQTSPSRSTIGTDRYVYGGSVTPLPRSRFQERLRSTSQQEVSSLSTPRMARSEVSGSRLSVESTNPFDGPPVPPVRASRRKKKKAPLPPGAADISQLGILKPEKYSTFERGIKITSEASELQTCAENSTLQTTVIEEKKPNGDLELEEDLNLNIELKIVEDEETKDNEESKTDSETAVPSVNKVEVTYVTNQKSDKLPEHEGKEPKQLVNSSNHIIKAGDSEESILDSVSFSKVDIVKYRRNSSVNENDIRLRRGNLEDFHELTTKRSKSLSNSLDPTYITYDINLNEKANVDPNGNDEPQKVVCKLYEDSSRKQSIDTISSTEKEFIEIDRVRREIESDINNLNAALAEDFSTPEHRLSFSEIKRKFDTGGGTPNPIPKPRRSHYGDSGSPVNGNIHM